MIGLQSKGNFKKTTQALSSMKNGDIYKGLDGLAQQGVNALANATPRDTGLAASSWGYTIKQTREKVSIAWTNDNVEGGVNVVILLQYGHGTGTGGYVEGRDFINPAIKPIFDKIAQEVWRKVTAA